MSDTFIEKDSLSVLIVDDESRWADTLKMILEEYFEVIEVAASLVEAKQKLQAKRPPFHVVLCDIRLNDADKENREGMRLIDEIEEYGGYTNIILITGYPEIETVREALRSQANYTAFDYLQKSPPGGLKPEAVREVALRAAEAAHKKRWLDRILLVEDSSPWQDYFKDLLIDDGYSVRTVVSFESGIEQIKRRPYRLVIVNLTTGNVAPDKGLDFISILNSLSPATKVIATSNEITIAQLRQAFTKFLLVDFFLRETQLVQFSPSFEESEFRQSVWKVCAPINVRFIVARPQISKDGEHQIIFHVVREGIAKEQGIPITLLPNRPSIELTVRVNGQNVKASPSQKTWHIPSSGSIDPLSFHLTITGKENLSLSYEVLAPNGWGDTRTMRLNTDDFDVMARGER